MICGQSFVAQRNSGILTRGSYLSAQIEEQIRAEIALQVKQEVAAQIGDHLPVSLEQQAEASKRQLVEVKHSLVNSSVYLSLLFCDAYFLMMIHSERHVVQTLSCAPIIVGNTTQSQH